jgi:biotin transport system substrate-specific component
MNSLSNPAIRRAFPTTRVLGDTLPATRYRDALLILGGAGLTTLGAQVSIHVPGSPVPITGQTLGVVLAGASIGMWRGIASQALYAVLGLFLPIYAGGMSGSAVLFGASGGYIFGFIIAAGITGWAAEHGADRIPLLAFGTFALAQLAIFGIGVPWLKFYTGIPWGAAIHEGFTIFILGGIVKAILAAILMPGAWKFARWAGTKN